jgi:hypothetical protein
MTPSSGSFGATASSRIRSGRCAHSSDASQVPAWSPRLPTLGLDGLKAQALARGDAQQTGAVLAPTSWWAADGVAFPYRLRLAADPITTLLSDALSQFARIGFTTIWPGQRPGRARDEQPYSLGSGAMLLQDEAAGLARLRRRHAQRAPRPRR